MEKKLPSSSHLNKLVPPPFLGGGGGHNEMMDHSTKVAIAWFLSQTHKSTFHHL